MSISVAEQVGVYAPSQFRDAVVQHIANHALPKLPEGEWWHLTATTPEAFVFLQDIVEPKVISVSEPETYVSVADNGAVTEKSWIFPSPVAFQRLSKEGEDDLRWQHQTSKTEIVLILSQRQHPIAAYEHHLRQTALVKRLAHYKFRAVQGIRPEDLDRIRRFIRDEKWVLMMRSDNELFWAFPLETDPEHVKAVDEALNREGFKILRVNHADRKAILKAIDLAPDDDALLLNPGESEIAVPVILPRRIIWLSRERACPEPQGAVIWERLLTLKIEFEARHGYDIMHGRNEMRIAGEEVRALLADIRSIRGSAMLDFGFKAGKVLMSLRFREESTLATEAVLPGYLEVFETITSELLNIANYGTADPQNPPTP